MYTSLKNFFNRKSSRSWVEDVFKFTSPPLNTQDKKDLSILLNHVSFRRDKKEEISVNKSNISSSDWRKEIVIDDEPEDYEPLEYCFNILIIENRRQRLYNSRVYNFRWNKSIPHINKILNNHCLNVKLYTAYQRLGYPNQYHFLYETFPSRMINRIWGPEPLYRPIYIFSVDHQHGIEYQDKIAEFLFIKNSYCDTVK